MPAPLAHARAILVARLERLVTLTEVYRGDINDTGVRMLSHAIDATMGDLEDAGLSGVEIGKIVSHAREAVRKDQP